jgi:four helix bundle protein
MAGFRDLEVWRQGHKLVLEVYRATKKFPKDELFGLTSQIRRCAVSVAGNIAEGNGRAGRNEYIQFLTIARGSLNETGYYVTLARDLGYVSSEEAQTLDAGVATVGRLLAGLIRSLKKDD